MMNLYTTENDAEQTEERVELVADRLMLHFSRVLFMVQEFNKESLEEWTHDAEASIAMGLLTLALTAEGTV